VDTNLIRCNHCGQLNRIDENKVSLGLQARCGSCKEPIFTQQPTIVTDSNFSKVVKESEVNAHVDFEGPCKENCKTQISMLKFVSEALLI
jgi:thioredoxin 2